MRNTLVFLSLLTPITFAACSTAFPTESIPTPPVDTHNAPYPTSPAPGLPTPKATAQTQNVTRITIYPQRTLNFIDAPGTRNHTMHNLPGGFVGRSAQDGSSWRIAFIFDVSAIEDTSLVYQAILHAQADNYIGGSRGSNPYLRICTLDALPPVFFLPNIDTTPLPPLPDTVNCEEAPNTNSRSHGISRTTDVTRLLHNRWSLGSKRWVVLTLAPTDRTPPTF